MENLADKYSHIPGWGMDADPENEPTYPMKNYTGDDHNRLNYEPPPFQPQHEEILMSIERPRKSAVFGTSTPPSGLSGMIRRYAFKYSESSYGHWLPLIIADRINVVEGILEDLGRGRIPNIFAERGGKAALKHNPQAVARNVITAVLVVSAVSLLIYRNSDNKKSPKKLLRKAFA
jgi:hypothetical protein